jgi:hypothetical protein
MQSIRPILILFIAATILSVCGVVEAAPMTPQRVELNYAGLFNSITYATCSEYNGTSCGSYSFAPRDSQSLPASGSISLGQAYSGKYVYDAAAPISAIVDARQGIYLNAIIDAMVLGPIGTYSRGPSSCCLSITSETNGSHTLLLTFSRAHGDLFVLSYLGLNNNSGSLFDGFQIPFKLSSEDFLSGKFFLNFLLQTSDDQVLMTGSVDSLLFKYPVSEPASSKLIAMAFLPLLFFSYRHSQWCREINR